MSTLMTHEQVALSGACYAARTWFNEKWTEEKYPKGISNETVLLAAIKESPDWVIWWVERSGNMNQAAAVFPLLLKEVIRLEKKLHKEKTFESVSLNGHEAFESSLKSMSAEERVNKKTHEVIGQVSNDWDNSYEVREFASLLDVLIEAYKLISSKKKSGKIAIDRVGSALSYIASVDESEGYFEKFLRKFVRAFCSVPASKQVRNRY